MLLKFQDEESKTFIESLKKKLSQRNIITGKNCDSKTTSPGDHIKDSTEFGKIHVNTYLQNELAPGIKLHIS